VRIKDGLEVTRPVLGPLRKLLLKKIVTTLYGLVVLHLHLFLLSNHNGLLSKNMKKMVPKSSIENAYEHVKSLDYN
jgi:hypothetical protein